MKYLLAQPANTRFKWELEVVLTNILSLDANTSIVVLFLESEPQSTEVIQFFRDKYPTLEIYSYNDDRLQINYPPTVRPYLIWRYLAEDMRRESGDYFQIDSDVIFRELPIFEHMMDYGRMRACWASDCSSYIGYDYLISREKGKYIVDKFAEIMNISVETIVETPGAGAQWVMVNPTAQMWYHIWQDSQILYDFLMPLNSNIQKWTAEMWAQLYNLRKFGFRVTIAPQLAFCRPTDPIGDWETTPILHNAGVTGTLARTLFYKGKYDQRSPFGDDLTYVDKTKAGLRYAEAINMVYNNNIV